MLINISTKERIWEHEFKGLFPNTSFPETISEDIYLSFGYAVLNYPPQPGITNLQKIIDSDVEQDSNGKWNVVWEVVDKDYLETQATITSFVNECISLTNQRLDSFAQSRGYDNIVTACSYVNSTIPSYSSEGQYCLSIRDQTWKTLYPILDDIKNGTVSLPPDCQDVISQLPNPEWTE